MGELGSGSKARSGSETADNLNTRFPMRRCVGFTHDLSDFLLVPIIPKVLQSTILGLSPSDSYLCALWLTGLRVRKGTSQNRTGSAGPS